MAPKPPSLSDPRPVPHSVPQEFGAGTPGEPIRHPGERFPDAERIRQRVVESVPGLMGGTVLSLKRTTAPLPHQSFAS